MYFQLKQLSLYSTVVGVFWLTAFLLIFQNQVFGQIGPVIWEDNFNTLDNTIWTPDIGDGCDIGLCGWGNQELQSYQSDNVYIADVPEEPGNKALVLEARNETAGSRVFTSGKVTTKKNLAIHYGLIEVRLRVPNLDKGLWPAAWLLGTANLTWPANGEIDIMEMGFSQAARNEQQESNSTVNNYVGANAFFPVEGGGVGNIAYDVDYNQPYVASTPLNDRFVTYRIYWEPTQVRFTVVDGGTEHDLYTNPLPIDAEGVTAPFSKPFYMLLNLAVGGTLPGVLNNGQVTAPLPGKMYVDYVRVSEWNGHGSVEFNYGDLTAEAGTFGVFTDQTTTNNELALGSDAEIYAWGGTLEEGTTLPFEGENVIAWKTANPNSWFGGGVVALNGKNMSNFVENGSLKFRIKIPADVSFRIGLTDNYTNEQYIEFPAGQTKYGLVRNGEWGQVEIPLEDFTGLLAFQDVGYMFAIASVDGALPASTFEFAIDDIVWDDGNTQDPPVVTNIAVSPANATINEGETVQFQANATDQYGDPISTNFTWSTSGGSISSSGLYTGNTVGNFTVTATSGGVNETANVTVNAVAVGTNIPGIIEAEDYEDGGYFDTTTGNTGGAYRSDDVDIENTGDASGNYNVGWVSNGEWLEYAIHATASSDRYDITFRVASPNGNGRFHLEIDGTDVTGILASPNTGAWQNYVDVTAEDVSISQGQHTMRVVFDNEGLNLNYTTLTEASPTGSSNCEQESANGDYTVSFSDNSSNPTATFIPSSAGIGNPTCILYYSTDANSTFPGYMVSPNTPVNINANNGQTVYLYYTYSVPGGGERNTADNKHSFVVGGCDNSGARRANTNSLITENQVSQSFSVYPNPIESELIITLTSDSPFKKIKITNLQGQLIKGKMIEDQSQVKIDTNEFLNGIYMVELSGSGSSEVVKVVK